MPWLTFGEPGFMTRLHQAQTSVGNLRAALTIFFMIGALDRGLVVFVHKNHGRKK
jgi:hypothetical protein